MTPFCQKSKTAKNRGVTLYRCSLAVCRPLRFFWGDRWRPRSLVSIDDVGVATAFLAHDSHASLPGETLYIDGGYHIVD
jgi:hypothetical protein